ncbi:putative lipid II flippase FtsW [Isoptericola sp. b441]|uniref:Probable peptidoglycan glycosyltransferase FtsW n=1 Tax=Actinotalea lenta TaxID=3064654 RepID=A0ABT9DDF4_9CELL|nr:MULTISPECIES: putative lipid II flippase FtsW [unclassified Isoptericola]MDO8107426.1 putative lipid II flippase FtsW [Isoptericola sp. b441]MDO8120912.1 putative lipid II flippase FtsW [Isoptericola sp. b490]
MTATRGTDVELTPRAPGTWNGPVTSYYLLVGATGLLLSIGLVMVLSSSTVDSLNTTKGATAYAVFWDQARYALIGLPVAWLASRLPVRFYRAIAWPALGAGVLLQLLVFTGLGIAVNGNRNWIGLAGFRMQPSEVLKLALAVWLGSVLATKRALLHRWLHVLVPAVVGALGVVGLVVAGKDLGTALIIILLAAGALFIAGVPLRMFVVAGTLVGVVIVQLAQTSNRMARITALFSPHCDAMNQCYQTVRGLYALASGGLTGEGLGQSRQKWAGLPEAHNDFIFAVIGEELGLLGAVLVIVLFAVLAVAMVRVIRRHPDPFVQISTAGIATWILGQALINVGVVIGVFPVVGLPLPLVSAGGSALITTLVALGVVVSFARSEPGAPEALHARVGAVQRSLAVIGRARSPRTGAARGGGRRG